MTFTDSMNQRIGWPTLALTWLGMVVALIVFGAAAGHGALAALPRALRDTLIGVAPWAAFRTWEAHRDPEDRGWHRWDLVVLVASTLLSWIVALIVLAVAVFHRARGEVSVVGAPARPRKAKRAAEPGPGVRAIQLGEAHNRPFYAPSHTLLVGPPGCGKTWTGLVPAIYHWDRTAPILAISTKADLAGPLAAIRARTQPVFGWDPSGTGIFNGIEGLEPVTFDLVQEIDNPDRAVFLADQIVRGAAMSRVEDGDFWATQGAMLLAALLWAARLEPGRDLGWVLDQAFGGADMWSATVKTPGMDAAPALEASLWSLIEAARGDGQRRVDSVSGTVQTALASYRLQSLRQSWARPLTMAEWAGRGGCLFVASPADQAKTLAPVIVGQVAAAIAAQRRAQHPAVLLAIDELANVCPLPDLATWLTELRSWGVTLLGAMQAWSQMSRWGKEQRVVEHAWPALGLFSGVSDHELLNEISVAAGETSGQSGTHRWLPHADVVGKLKPGQVRFVVGRTPTEILRLSPVRELTGR
ncbi:MAG: TraM recognition domain-containing protein [Actinobacteria bacterium]|nr:TraM recognition domain-containing protein [Actinomycetota bacterium]